MHFFAGGSKGAEEAPKTPFLGFAFPILLPRSLTIHCIVCEMQRRHPDVEAVSVGAILSNYQRVRVEHV